MKTISNTVFKNIISIVLFVLLLYLLLLISQLLFNKSDLSKEIVVAKDLINIIFFIILATLGIFSYQQAKKTLFTPIKTETFKLQIKLFENILLYFQEKGEIEFRNQFDFYNILYHNARMMTNSYTQMFFKGQIVITEMSDKEKKEFSGIIASQKFMEENFSLVDYDSKFEIKEKVNNSEIKDPAIKLANWLKYEHGIIRVSNKYSNEIKKINILKSSPLLPSKLRDLLSDFIGIVSYNLMEIEATLTEIAKEMPEKFSTADKLIKFEPAWISNRYNRRIKDLGKKSKEILDFINEYLGIESLIK